MLIRFLQSLAIETVILSESSNNFGWNHLHFLGHSLGAHISGQVGHLLKNDKFWHVERITGFDPANPCFKYADMSLKLDSGDAAFVDVIHTQSNLGGEYDLGLRQNIAPTGEDYEKLDLLIEIAYHSPKRKNQPVDWNGNSQFYDFAEDALTMDNIK
ncbi:hypothetical protein QAD02_019807 [Eretmocerus hayati]|uniref:Uncharacterized protein n=1 Tax=Eretmocerus hayati TaxID=131215 RepID=A0ACC2PQF8_9HYME|nr:hypothetical protein QAD02_019807 [Eretmocerus hayati]